MCARRFLILIVVLTLLGVVGAFAIFQFGDRALTGMATPKGHFEAPPAISGPDYANHANWIARPELLDNPTFWAPEGFSEPLADLPVGEASLFYVHPTT